MNDLLCQTSFIVNSIERILLNIDHDPLSPTYGCAHLAYWRDKTSGVADMRRQEVLLPLTLLYSYDYPGSEWNGSVRVKRAIEALLSFWCINQYCDGSLDEWYKGERGYAAVAFSTHAVARAFDIIISELEADIVLLIKDKLKKTAYWLTRHDDLFKTNHQAVGVAALAWVGKVLQDDILTQNAYKKLDSIVEKQTKDGWFPEIGHMDVGYTFLTVEFIAMTFDLWNDWQYIDTFKRAFDFASEWIHPNMTIGEEYGICHNRYLSRIAIVLMSKYSSRASFLRNRLEKESFNSLSFMTLLADDLRLFRWAYQPLLAYDYANKNPIACSLAPENTSLSNPNTETKIYYEASIVRFSCSGCTGVFSAAAGGLVRFFGFNEGKSFTDYGYAICIHGKGATNYTYNGNTKINVVENGLKINTPISLVKKFMPSFVARAALHLGCSTSISSRLVRKIIDFIRLRKGTAINQSSFSLASSNTLWNLERQVYFQEYHVRVKDIISFKKSIAKHNLFFLESVDEDWMSLKPVTFRLPDISEKLLDIIEISKIYCPGDNWFLSKISVKVKT